MLFYNILLEKGIDPKVYLNIAQKEGSVYGYTGLQFSDDPKYKLKIQNPKYGKYVYFGSAKHNDFIIYKILEKTHMLKKGTADKRQILYLSRATNILGDWMEHKYSRNNLAIHILW